MIKSFNMQLLLVALLALSSQNMVAATKCPCTKPPKKTFVVIDENSGKKAVLELLKKLFPSLNFIEELDSIRDENAKKVSSGRIALACHAAANDENRAVVENNDLYGVVVVRDPRDLLVEQAEMLVNEYQKDEDALRAKKYDFEKVVNVLISLEVAMDEEDDDFDAFLTKAKKDYSYSNLGLKKLADSVKKYMPWKASKRVYVTKFEKLAGKKCGGTREEQVQEIQNIAHHLGLRTSKSDAQKIADNLVETGDGSVGRWKTMFTEENKEAFKKYSGSLLVELGYEKDNNW